MTGTGEPRRDTSASQTFDGVTLEQWAFVTAGLGDGLPLDDLLAYVSIHPDRWASAEASFQETVLEDLEQGGGLSELVDELMRAARAKWVRPIPPLDEDLRAWLDFWRAWATHDEPLQFLRVTGLRGMDVLRLQDHWRARTEADPDLRAKILRILSSPPGSPPTPKPEPARLLKETADQHEPAGDTKPMVPLRYAAPLPFTDQAAAHLLPPLSVPLPVPETRGRRRAGGTALGLDRVPELVLPFTALSQEQPAAVAGEGDAGARETAHATSDTTASTEPLVLTLLAETPTPEVTDDAQESIEARFPVEKYAALCVELSEDPSHKAQVLERHGLAPQDKARIDAFWVQRMTADPGIWLAWDRACATHRAGLGGKVPT